MVAHPAEERHATNEEDGNQKERNAETGRIGSQPGRATDDGVGVAGRGECLGEEGPDARCGTDRESTAKQYARTALARALNEPARHDPVGPGQQAHEGKTGDDEDEARDRLLRLVVHHIGDQVRRSAQRHEHDREAGDEREARDRDAPTHARVAKALRLDRRDRREIPRHER